MEQNILVIGHEDNKHPLPNGFRFVQRASQENLEIKGVHRFRNSSLVWSEYSAWFENMEFLKGEGTKGVCHYRCALNLSTLKLSFMPYQLRWTILKRIESKVANKRNYIIVGKPIATPEGMWKQYLNCEPSSIRALEFVCMEYDRIIGEKNGTTLERMQKAEKFIIRNVFITDTTFANDWSHLSLSIAIKLDDAFFNEFDNRWGGFVLERLFSIYVEDFVKIHNTNLFFENFVYFLELRKWIRHYTPKKFKKTVRKLINRYSDQI